MNNMLSEQDPASVEFVHPSAGQPILLAEDDDNDALLIQRAFKRAGWSSPVIRMINGEQVIEHLEGYGTYSQGAEYTLPSLLLLDLKMPRKSGFEVLEWLRKHPDFERLLVVVLTSCGLNADARRAYDLGVNMFLIKSPRFEGLVEHLKKLQNYWLLHQQSQLHEP
jgi:CheY-like chemotaxis protein